MKFLLILFIPILCLAKKPVNITNPWYVDSNGDKFMTLYRKGIIKLPKNQDPNEYMGRQGLPKNIQDQVDEYEQDQENK